MWDGTSRLLEWPGMDAVLPDFRMYSADGTLYAISSGGLTLGSMTSYDDNFNPGQSQINIIYPQTLRQEKNCRPGWRLKQADPADYSRFRQRREPFAGAYARVVLVNPFDSGDINTFCQQMQLELSAGRGPDLMDAWTIDMEGCIQNGYIAPLDDIMENPSDYWEVSMERGIRLPAACISVVQIVPVLFCKFQKINKRLLR